MLSGCFAVPVLLHYVLLRFFQAAPRSMVCTLQLLCMVLSIAACSGDLIAVSRTYSARLASSSSRWDRITDVFVPNASGSEGEDGSNGYRTCAAATRPVVSGAIEGCSVHALCDTDDNCPKTNNKKLLCYTSSNDTWTPQEANIEVPTLAGAMLHRLSTHLGQAVDALVGSSCNSPKIGFMVPNSQGSWPTNKDWQIESFELLRGVECAAVDSNGRLMLITRWYTYVYRVNVASSGDVRLDFEGIVNYLALISEGYGCQSLTTPGGLIYVSGGSSNGGRRSDKDWSNENFSNRVTVTTLNGQKYQMEFLPELEVARRDHGMAVMNGYLYVAGGMVRKSARVLKCYGAHLYLIKMFSVAASLSVPLLSKRRDLCSSCFMSLISFFFLSIGR